jgi:hypothetical protein
VVKNVTDIEGSNAAIGSKREKNGKKFVYTFNFILVAQWSNT